MKKKKPLKIGKRVVIGNSAVTAENLNQALDFFKKKKAGVYKFLKVTVVIYPGALVLAWAVKNLGFGEVTYYLNQGKIQVDAEGMNDKFVQALHREVIKQHRKKQLEIHYAEDLLASVLDRFAAEVKNNQ